MAQLESGQALSKIPHTTTRNLVAVLIETGLRGGDACTLPFSPVLTDSSGWPCLRFEAAKVRSEQLIPLSAKAAAAIGAQQDHVRHRWPAGSPWLFPGIAGNHDGSKPYSHSAFSRQLAHWQRVIDLRDKAGQPVTVTAHQFRHTLVICTSGPGPILMWCRPCSDTHPSPPRPFTCMPATRTNAGRSRPSPRGGDTGEPPRAAGSRLRWRPPGTAR